MAEKDHPFDQIANTVGQVCLWWGAIESVTHDLVLHSSCCLQKDFERTRAWDILHLMLTHMNTRAKFSMVKILAHHLESPSSPNLYDRVEELINYLDKKARPERNRFVHDDWDVQGEEVLRSQIGAKIRRPQAPQRELSVWTERRFPDITQIRAFVRNLELAYGDLVDLDSHLAWLASHQELPGLRSQPLPPEWKSLTHRDWRDANMRKPQPRP